MGVQHDFTLDTFAKASIQILRFKGIIKNLRNLNNHKKPIVDANTNINVVMPYSKLNKYTIAQKVKSAALLIVTAL